MLDGTFTVIDGGKLAHSRIKKFSAHTFTPIQIYLCHKNYQANNNCVIIRW